MGKVIFELRASELEITSHRLGQKTVTRVPVSSLSAKYTYGAQRYPALIFIPLLAIGVCIWIIEGLLTQDKIALAEAAITPLLMYPGMAIVVSALIMLKGVRRVEFFQFFDHWQKPAFTIIRDRTQVEECEAFVSELLYLIEQTEAGETYSAPPRETTSAALLPPAETGGPFGHGSQWWTVSVCLGLVGLIYPLLVYQIRELVSSAFFVVLGAGIGGGVCGVRSLEASEPRFWSIAGLVLSAAPIVIYFIL